MNWTYVFTVINTLVELLKYKSASEYYIIRLCYMFTVKNVYV